MTLMALKDPKLEVFTTSISMMLKVFLRISSLAPVSKTQPTRNFSVSSLGVEEREKIKEDLDLVPCLIMTISSETWEWEVWAASALSAKR